MSVTQQNAKFYELLSAISEKSTYDLLLTNNKTYKFKQLTTNHLKELIETVVDTSLTKIKFDLVSSKIFKECLVSSGEETSNEFNIIDRLLFVIEARIQAISPTAKMFLEEQEGQFDVNLSDIKNKLASAITQKNPFVSKTISNGEIEITCFVPSIESDVAQNEINLQKNDPDLTDENSVRDLLGNAFVEEIAKTIKTIKINEETINLLELSFEERIKLIETLPASAINCVIDYVEQYKEILDECTQTPNGTFVPDGAMFSVR